MDKPDLMAMWNGLVADGVDGWEAHCILYFAALIASAAMRGAGQEMQEEASRNWDTDDCVTYVAGSLYAKSAALISEAGELAEVVQQATGSRPTPAREKQDCLTGQSVGKIIAPGGAVPGPEVNQPRGSADAEEPTQGQGRSA